MAHLALAQLGATRCRNFAEEGLGPNWKRRVEVLSMDPAASMHPVSVLRHSKGDGRATYLTPTQDALVPGTPTVVNHSVP
jgi:hypothetical protein